MLDLCGERCYDACSERILPMTDSDSDSSLIRWAAAKCRWGGSYVSNAISVSKYRHPRHRGTHEYDPADEITLPCESPETYPALGALAFDLLAKFVEATPEPTVRVGDNDESLHEWYAWIKQRAQVTSTIPQGPMSVIRAIHGTGVLQ